MADDLTYSGSGATVPANTKQVTDEHATRGHMPIVKVAYSADGDATLITADANGLEVQGAGVAGTPAGGVVSVQGVGSGTALPVSAASLPLPSGASTAANQSTANTALSAIQTAVELLDNTVSGSELQVDVLTMPTVTVDSELTTADLDTGAGTDTRAVVGLVGSASGGGQLIPGSATDGLLVNLGTNNDVTVTGTVTANLAAGTNNIGDVDVLSIAAGDNNIGNVDVVTLPALPTGTNVIGSVKITDGTDTALVDGSGNLMVNVAAGGAGDGAILDGVSSAIKATVLDYTNSNPLAVRLTDTSGDYVGAGAGTQYTEDAAAAADPVGTALNLIRKDTLAGLTSADGDNVAARGTDKGELYVKHVDTIAVTQSGTWDEVGINDSGNSITIDNAALSVTGGGVEASALRVTIASDSTGVLSVDDNGGTLTVDGTVTVGTMANLTESLVDDAVFTPATSRVVPIGFEFDDTTPDSVDEGDIGAARMSANRNIYTTLRDAAGNERGANVNASNQLSVSVDNTVTVGSHAVTNAGTFAVQVDGNALTALQLIDDTIFADDAAFTPGTSKVSVAGFQADETTTDSVDEGDAGAARMTLDRKVIVQPQPHTAGGLSIFRTLDLDETEEEVKATAGQVYGWAVTNTATSTRWLKFYNATAANVTVGTTTPVITWGIPGNTSDDVAANALGAMGIAFDTAICVAATTGVADNDTGAPAANDLIVNIFYK